MMCDSVRELLHALLDEELDAGRRSDLEFHLQSCPGCAEEHHKLTELRRSIRSDAPYFKAPDQLALRVKTALRDAARAEERRHAPWIFASIAASLACAAALVWGIVAFRSNGSEKDFLVHELVASHVRSLLPGHLVDVASSDNHTVKPWFTGKIDFSPRVKDLTAEGFPLVGGRLDYLDHGPVAALVFYRRQHVINLYVWPSADIRNAAFTRNGFNILVWSDNGLAYWAVSDVNAGDLRELERLYRE